MSQPIWECFDSDILFSLSDYDLGKTMAEYKHKTGRKLVITSKIRNELIGRGDRKQTDRYKRPDTILELIKNGIIEIKDPNEQEGSGEDTLMALINEQGKVGKIFNSKDKAALNRAKWQQIKTDTLTDYLSWLVDNKLLKCSMAIKIIKNEMMSAAYQ